MQSLLNEIASDLMYWAQAEYDEAAAGTLEDREYMTQAERVDAYLELSAQYGAWG